MQDDTFVDSSVGDALIAEGADPLAVVTAERDRLTQERAELQDLLLRRQAEFENARRRVEREKTEHARYAAMDTVRELLPTLDDLDRALKSASNSDPAQQEFLKGFELIHQRLGETLKRLGLEAIPAANQKFDPHVHHAVEMVQSDELEDHTILDEYQTGYKYKDVLLRPAMVKVSVKP